jgi:2'-hydroxyisoflavone reductase
MPGPDALRVTALSTAKAEGSGFSCRPIDETIRDTWEWDRRRPRPLPRGPVGTRYTVETIEPAQEAELVELWRLRQT